MNSYDALVAAADHIESHPDLYGFMYGQVPRAPSHHACMLARMGQFLGEPAGRQCEGICEEHLGISAMRFYERIGRLVPRMTYDRDDAKLMAPAMRRYARHYLDKKTGIPKEVREIFDIRNEEIYV